MESQVKLTLKYCSVLSDEYGISAVTDQWFPFPSQCEISSADNLVSWLHPANINDDKIAIASIGKNKGDYNGGTGQSH